MKQRSDVSRHDTYAEATKAKKAAKKQDPVGEYQVRYRASGKFHLVKRDKV